MHTLRALSTLFLQPLLTVPTTALLPSDVRNEISIPSPYASTPSSSALTSSNSLRSPISLTFDVFGSQLPSTAVNAAFQGAITRIYPFLQNQPDAPIANDNFQYRAIGGSVQIGVTAVLHHAVSWRQLSLVLRQASSFMNGGPGVGRQHMQELSFEIIEDGTTMGEGLVSYRPSRGLQPGDRAPVNLTNANDTNPLLAPTDPSLNATTENAIRFHIPDTPFTLIFGFLGDAVPISGVWAAFEGAHSRIVGPLGQHPTSPIPGNRFEYDKQGVRITVLANRETVITWKQLSWILGGMYGFMTGSPERYQLLTCEIAFSGHANVGFASLWYYPPRGLEVTKRALRNTTISLPLVSKVSVPIPFPVPNTPNIITFTYLGITIPWRELHGAIFSALDQIRPSYTDHSTGPVPGNHFFRALNGVRIAIFANVPHVMSWFQLYNILWGLLLFVSGAETGHEHHRVMDFDVDDTRAGKLAYGTLRYAVSDFGDVREEN